MKRRVASCRAVMRWVLGVMVLVATPIETSLDLVASNPWNLVRPRVRRLMRISCETS